MVQPRLPAARQGRWLTAALLLCCTPDGVLVGPAAMGRTGGGGRRAEHRPDQEWLSRSVQLVRDVYSPPAGVRRAADPHPFRAPVAAPECSGETAPDADLVPMRHPEGIGCSFGGVSYLANQDGIVRVPAEAVPHLRAHGFVLVQADREP